MSKFTHLRVHTDNSLLKGYGTIKEYVNWAKENEHSALAITDFATMTGAYTFMIECKKNGIKPLIGAVFNIQQEEHEYNSVFMPYDHTHLTLFAKNKTGIYNLFKLIYLSSLTPSKEDNKFTITKNTLKDYSGGLLCLSGDCYSELVYCLNTEQEELAHKEISELKEIFNNDVYIEIVATDSIRGYSSHKVFEFAKKVNIPTVVTNHVYYLQPADRDGQELFSAVGSGFSMDTTPTYKGGIRPAFADSERYLKTAEEMEEYMRYLKFSSEQIEELFTNTNKLADSIEDFELEYDNTLRPPAIIPSEYKNAFEYLKFLVYKGFQKKRLGMDYENKEEILAESKRRIREELEVIHSNDFVEYFIVVQEFILWSRKNGFEVGCGRGSVAGSEVAFLLDISRTDPIRFNLLFERFISPGRGAIYQITYDNGEDETLNVAQSKLVEGTKKYIYQLRISDIVDNKTVVGIKIIDPGSSPDVDTDFRPDAREHIINHCKELYGEANVAQLITPGPFKAKNAFRTVCQAYNTPMYIRNKIAELLPESVSQVTISELLDENNPDGQTLRAAIAENDTYKNMIELASRFNGRQRETGVHACGVIISSKPVYQSVPVHKIGEHGLLTQWNYHICESLGLIKMDFLGLETMAIIQETIEAIKKRRNLEINIEELIYGPLDDDLVYKMFQNGDTFGIFQFSEDGVRELLKKVKPTEFIELAAITALYRPGPMSMKAHEEYAVRKNNINSRIPVCESFINTPIDSILKETFGALVYQEQIMKISQQAAGFTSKEADKLRKAVGKKDMELMQSIGEKFISGMIANGYNEEDTKKLWSGIVEFGKYCFNKSHSVSYALNSYLAAYLKVHYPVEFMSVSLQRRSGSDKITQYLDEAYRLGLRILPPSVADSYLEMAPITDTDIVYGLSCLKGIQSDFIRHIIQVAKGGKFLDLSDFIRRTDCKQANLISLAKAGCFDCFGVSRKGVVENADQIIKSAHKIGKIEQTINLLSMFDNASAEDVATFSIPKEEWKPSDRSKYEAEITAGMYLSGNPLSKIILRNGEQIGSSNSIKTLGQGDSVLYVTFTNKRQGKTKDGKYFIGCTCNDGQNEFSLHLGQHIVNRVILYNLLGKMSKEEALAQLQLDGEIEPLEPIELYVPYRLELTKNHNGYINVKSVHKILLSKNDREFEPLQTISGGKEVNRLIGKKLQEIVEEQAGVGCTHDIILYNANKTKTVELYNMPSVSILLSYLGKYIKEI